MKTIYEQVNLIAHRGFSGRYCENTYTAFLSACKKDFFGIETDVQFTADNKIVCFHDKTLKRLNGDSRRICEFKYKELKKKDLSVKNQKDKYKICPFKKYLKLCNKYNKQCVIEIKGQPKHNQIDTLLKLVKRKRKLENCIFISFNLGVLQHIRHQHPSVRLQLLISRPLKHYLNTCAENNIHISFLKQLIKSELIKKVHDKGLTVSAWVVNTKPEAQSLIDMGVANITSNFLL